MLKAILITIPFLFALSAAANSELTVQQIENQFKHTLSENLYRVNESKNEITISLDKSLGESYRKKIHNWSQKFNSLEGSSKKVRVIYGDVTKNNRKAEFNLLNTVSENIFSNYVLTIVFGLFLMLSTQYFIYRRILKSKSISKKEKISSRSMSPSKVNKKRFLYLVRRIFSPNLKLKSNADVNKLKLEINSLTNDVNGINELWLRSVKNQDNMKSEVFNLSCKNNELQQENMAYSKEVKDLKKRLVNQKAEFMKNLDVIQSEFKKYVGENTNSPEVISNEFNLETIDFMKET